MITRERAVELGLRRYFTGVPCEKHGHICERIVQSYSCVDCRNLQRNANRAANRQEVRDKNNAYLAKNRDRAKAWWAAHYEKNKEHHRERAKTYSRANREKVTQRALNKRATDIQDRIRHRLRERMRSAIKTQQKAGSAIRDLGCTVAELMAHIEGQFLPGMTWENWGSQDGMWQIDHKTPLSSFDLTDRDQFLVAVHFTNLQPLWRFDNMSKGAKLIA